MSIFRHIVGIASELALQKDPYDTYEPPRIIHDSGHIQRVRAASGTESTRHWQGITPQGNKTIVSTHRTDIRRGIYDIHIEDW